MFFKKDRKSKSKILNNFDKKNKQGETVLHLCSEQPNTSPDLVHLLIERYKSDVNAVDNNGWTPLHSAASSGNIEICNILLDYGAFARALTDDGAGVLHYMSKSQISPTKESIYETVFKKFLEKGADINHQNRFGEAPLHCACYRGHIKCAHLLLNAKDIKINLRTITGETPLSLASRNGHFDIVKLLLSKGADDTISSDEGTPLEIAQKYKLNRIVELLTRHKTQNVCGCCSAKFYPQHFHCETPDQWKEMNLTNVSDNKTRLSSDLCQILENFFVRCLLEIPIKHKDERHFDNKKILSGDNFNNVVFGIWVKVSKTDFDKYVKRWKVVGRQSDPPIEGKIANQISVYQKNMLDIPVSILTRNVGLRPLCIVKNSDHPIYLDQKNGIFCEEALANVQQLLNTLQNNL